MKSHSIFHTLTVATLVVFALLSTSLTAWGQTKYYRYTNKEGVKVMNSVVPPEYVKYGYEVVTLSGQVLEVVEPAPTPEEAEQLAAKRQRQMEIEKWDEYLLKRYSTVADIEAAKERKLADFEGSVSILRGNAANVRGQIEQVQARAANMERAGRKVSDSTLNSLRALEMELKDTEQQLALREADKLEISKKYDADIERFREIRPDDESADQ